MDDTVGCIAVGAEVGCGSWFVGAAEGSALTPGVTGSAGQEPRQNIVGITKKDVGDAVNGEVGIRVLSDGGVTEPPKLISTVPAGIPLMFNELVVGSYVQPVSGVPLTETAVGCLVV
jgi:hypothetical protein